MPPHRILPEREPSDREPSDGKPFDRKSAEGKSIEGEPLGRLLPGGDPSARMPESETEGASEFVRSLERGLAVVRTFDAEHPSLTLSEVAARTGFTRASTRRFLLTLEQLGYVRSSGRAFTLTARVLELGYSYLSALGLPEIAEPHLEVLSHALGESTSASVMDGDDIVYVARVLTRRIMTVSIAVGTRFPAYATSMGRVLLAARGDAEVEEYLRGLHAQPLTASTRTDSTQLRAVIRQVREQGFALVDGELEQGLRSVAAPVSRRGEVVGAINVSTTAAVTTLDQLRARFVPALRETASRITAELSLQR